MVQILFFYDYAIEMMEVFKTLIKPIKVIYKKTQAHLEQEF